MRHVLIVGAALAPLLALLWAPAREPAPPMILLDRPDCGLTRWDTPGQWGFCPDHRDPAATDL